jgi:hypothetical protein
MYNRGTVGQGPGQAQTEMQTYIVILLQHKESDTCILW